jgi:hypothetical protein
LVPLRAHKDKETILLRYFTATAFNYAIFSPLIYWLAFGHLFAKSPIELAAAWFIILFIAPALLGIFRALMIQEKWLNRFYKWLGLKVTAQKRLRWFHSWFSLRSINPIPTGWDWIFSTTDPCYVLITLNDGTEIAGFFGDHSMASSDPERKDIYIERVYTVPEDNRPWVTVDGSLGMHVDGSQIAYIEFREA